jgi:tetratricopeptide (TPR) repeat protein
MALASRRVLLLVVDDLQWADTGSINLLFHLGRELAGHPILLVGAYRPSEVILDWSASSSVSFQTEGRDEVKGEPNTHPLSSLINEFKRIYGKIEISLPEDDPSFVDAFLDTFPNKLSASFHQTLYNQTGGNPLFTIELLHGMQERGDLILDEEEYWIEGPTLDWETIPERVEAVFAEHVNRLPAQFLDILRISSVEGEIFTAETVARVTDSSEDEVLQILSGKLGREQRLVRAQEVRQVDSRRLSQYRFQHILLQKFLYSKLDPVEKTHLHQKVGSALETLYAASEDDIEAISGDLAWHFAQGNVPEKAVTYSLKAGQRAMRLSAYEEAIQHFSTGLELLRLLPESPLRYQQELALQVGLVVPLQSKIGYSSPIVENTYARVLELSSSVEQTPEYIPLLWLFFPFYTTRGEYHKAREVVNKVLHIAEEAGDPVMVALAHMATGWNMWLLGEQQQSLKHLEMMIEFYDPVRFPVLEFIWYGVNPGVTSLLYSSLTLSLLGFPNKASKRCRQALVLAGELSHPMTLANAQALACLAFLLCGDAQSSFDISEECIKTSQEHGFNYWLASAIMFSGWALTNLGRTEEGFERMRQGYIDYHSTGAEMGFSQQATMLATAYLNSGEPKQGLLEVNKALDFVFLSGEGYHEAELYRLKGELLLMQVGDEAYIELNFQEAEHYFKKGLEISRQQHAKKWELRAAVSLARLWKKLGKNERGYQLLNKVYNWFTEGFDTPDLIIARELLDELNANTAKKARSD